MRRTTCGWIALLALCALPAMAAAEGWTVSVQGGASVPSGDFGSEEKLNAETGWSIGAAGDYTWNATWAFGFDGSWSQNANGIEGQVTDLGGGSTSTIDQARFGTWQVGAHARYFIPTGATSQVKWYGIVGAGLYGFGGDLTETVASGSSSTTTTLKMTDKRAGMKLGLGGLWWVNPQLGVNAGIDYHVAFLDKDQSPFSSLPFMGAYLGLTFNIPKSTQ